MRGTLAQCRSVTGDWHSGREQCGQRSGRNSSSLLPGLREGWGMEAQGRALALGQGGLRQDHIL